MVPQLVVLALEFHRTPLRFGHLTDPALQLPDSFTNWLSEAGNALAPANIQQTADTLGAPPAALREAFLFFLRQTLLLPQADHYRVLGLPRGCTAEAVKHHHSLLVRLFHPDRMPDDEERSIALTARINAAYQTLREPQARKRYDSGLGRPPFKARSHPDTAAFFQPRDPLSGFGTSARRWQAVPVRARSGLLWTLVAVCVIVLLMLAFREPRQPTLRVNPKIARSNAPGPSFLHGTQAESGLREQTPDRTADRLPLDVPVKVPVEKPDSPAATGAKFDAEMTAHEIEPAPEGLAIEPDSAAAPADIMAVASTVMTPAKSPPAAADSIIRQPPHTEPARSTQSGKSPSRGTIEVAEQHPSVARVPNTKAARREREVTDQPPSAHTATVARPRKEPLDSRKSQESGESASGEAEKVEQTTVKRAESGASGRASSNAAIKVLVGRLERAYASGDLADLVGLFTANAIVNGGMGSAAVRQAYSDAVGDAGKRRLSVSNLRWHITDDQRIIAAGAVRLGTRSGVLSAWRYAGGSIDLELVPWMGDYKIARMVQRIPRQ
jgi:hypothetical protein